MDRLVQTLPLPALLSLAAPAGCGGQDGAPGQTGAGSSSTGDSSDASTSAGSVSDSTGGTDATGTESASTGSTTAETDGAAETETGNPGAVAGYTLVHTEPGPTTASMYGLIVGVVEHPDGARWMATDFGAPRTVRVHRGSDHSVVHTLQAGFADFGVPINAAADADADGVLDYLVGALGFDEPGQVLAFSSETGDELWRISGAMSGDRLGPAAFIGDVDEDGQSDLVVGAASEGTGGRVFVLSGSDRTTLDTIDAPQGDGDFGARVEATGDLDGDGLGDFLVTAPFEAEGAVYLYSGADRTEIRRIGGEADAQPLVHGASVAMVGDIDADGTGDVAVGCVQCSPGGRAESGYVAVYSGADGQRLHRFDGPGNGAGLGHDLVGLGDVDGDGVDDLAFASPGSLFAAADAAGIVEVRSGLTGALVWQAEAVEGTTLGTSLAAGDLDGDGLVDLIVGGSTADGRGAVLIYQAEP